MGNRIKSNIIIITLDYWIIIITWDCRYREIKVKISSKSTSAHGGEILGFISVTQRSRPRHEAILFPWLSCRYLPTIPQWHGTSLSQLHSLSLSFHIKSHHFCCTRERERMRERFIFLYVIPKLKKFWDSKCSASCFGVSMCALYKCHCSHYNGQLKF